MLPPSISGILPDLKQWCLSVYHEQRPGTDLEIEMHDTYTETFRAWGTLGTEISPSH